MVESLLEILTKKTQAFYKPVDLHFMTNAKSQGISSIRIWNIVKSDFYCGSVVHSLKERKLFSDQMTGNLRCLNSAANEIIQLNTVEQQESFF